jgi:phage terminase large subunit
MYQETTTFQKIANLNKRIRIVQGGSSAGKTIALLLYLIDFAQSHKGKTISIVSATLPHLKRGAIKDFLNIMQTHKYYNDDNWNKTNFTYSFETGSSIEFFSADQPSKVRGPRRDVLFINECNNLPFETYTQLSIRTNDFIFLDYNPVSSFWVHDEVIPKFEHDFIIVTYKDNEALPETIVKELESRRNNKAFWQVYGEGKIGEAMHRIYTGWAMIDEIPHEARLVRYGMDFGYTNDPTAILAIYYYNGGYILDEVIYQKGLSNKDIADILNVNPKATVIADSAEPKSIDEIKSYGVIVLPATKGQGSINQGIQYIQEQRISVTKRSTNLWKEYSNYLWMTDKDGKILNVPQDFLNHCCDALRYGFDKINPDNQIPKIIPQNNFQQWTIQ